MRDVALRSIWEPVALKQCGPRKSRIFVSHWNRERPHILVAYTIGEDGVKRSRVSIHPDVLRREYRPALAPVGTAELPRDA